MYDRKEMFKATCSECGDNCEVPFKPTGSKPVLCSSCFGQNGGRDSRGGGRDRGDRGNRRSFDRNDRSGDRTMHQATCDKCGEKCEVPFRPTAGKPIYCNNCFSKSSDRGDRRGGGDRDRRGGGSGGGQSSQQFESLNKKLDRIISLLESGTGKKESPKKETAVESVLKKPVAEKKAKAKTEKKSAKKTAKKKK